MLFIASSQLYDLIRCPGFCRAGDRLPITYAIAQRASLIQVKLVDVGASYTVTYHKPAVSPQLLAAYLPGENDPRTGLTQAEFLARAGRLANEKARELDWIV